MRILVDPNHRDATGYLVVARLSNASDPQAVAVGDTVVAFESEDAVRAQATVTAVDRERDLVTLDIDWDSSEDDEDADLLAEWLAGPGARPTTADRERWAQAVRDGRMPVRRRPTGDAT